MKAFLGLKSTPALDMRPRWLRPLALICVIFLYVLIGALTVFRHPAKDITAPIENGLDVTLAQEGDGSIEDRLSQQEISESRQAASSAESLPQPLSSSSNELMTPPPENDEADVSVAQKQIEAESGSSQIPVETEELTKNQAPPRKEATRTTTMTASAQAAQEEREASRRGMTNGQSSVNAANAVYAGLISAEISRHKFYPRNARIAGVKGAVRISFSIGASGKVEDCSIIESSGDQSLDEGVLKMMRSVQAPPPPEGIFKSNVKIRFDIKK